MFITYFSLKLQMCDILNEEHYFYYRIKDWFLAPNKLRMVDYVLKIVPRNVNKI